MWEGTGRVGEAVCRRVQTPQEHGTPRTKAQRAWKPVLTPCGCANGGRLEQTVDLSLPCRSCGRSRLGLGRDRAPLARLARQCHPVTGNGSVGRRWKQEGCDARLEKGEGSGC